MIKINIARQFTNLPGPRRREQGDGSGEEFREKYLKPAFERALRGHQKVLVQLDGARFGYPTSFLEEAFGGLAREYGIDEVQRTLVFESATEPMLDYEIRKYIERANRIRGTDWTEEEG